MRETKKRKTLAIVETEGVYSRDMGRVNSREGGRGRSFSDPMRMLSMRTRASCAPSEIASPLRAQVHKIYPELGP